MNNVNAGQVSTHGSTRNRRQQKNPKGQQMADSMSGHRRESSLHKYGCSLITETIERALNKPKLLSLCKPRLHKAQGQSVRAERNLESRVLIFLSVGARFCFLAFLWLLCALEGLRGLFTTRIRPRLTVR